MKKSDSATPDSKSDNIQTKDKVKCQHFSIRGYAVDMRQKNSKAGNPFEEITDNKWEQIRPPLDIHRFRCWDCINCVREIGISGTLTQPELKKNSRTLNGDENSPLLCLNIEPNKDSSFEHTIAKEANGKSKEASTNKKRTSAFTDIMDYCVSDNDNDRATKKSRPIEEVVNKNSHIAATCTLSPDTCALPQRGEGGSNLSALSRSCDELYLQVVDQTVAYVREHQDEFSLSPNLVRILAQDLVQGNSELPPNHPVAKLTQYNLIHVMIDLLNNIFETDGPGKMKRDTRISKTELSEELERQKKEIVELEEMICASNIGSPKSNKSSYQPLHEDIKAKLEIVKELIVDNECIELVIIPPTKKEGRCELTADNIDNKVAFGMVFDEAEMNGFVHGVPMPVGCIRVSADEFIQPDALLPMPLSGELEKVQQAIGSQVEWSRDLIIFPKMDLVKKRKEAPPSKLKNELQKIKSLFNKVELNKNVPNKYNLLYKYASTFMKASGTSIEIPCDADVFGIETTIFILDENLIALLEFDMIGQSVISVYMAYLQTLICKNQKNDDVVMYGFFDPRATFTLNSEFELYVVNRLGEGNYYNRMYFMPYNHDAHWILVIIWDGDIYLLNPLPHSTYFPELEKSLSSALKSYHAQTGRKKRAPKIINLVGSPKQPGGHECGYVVMRYMRDIIFDKKTSFTTKWATKTLECYTMQDLDEVRLETLEFIEDKM